MALCYIQSNILSGQLINNPFFVAGMINVTSFDQTGKPLWTRWPCIRNNESYICKAYLWPHISNDSILRTVPMVILADWKFQNIHFKLYAIYCSWQDTSLIGRVEWKWPRLNSTLICNVTPLTANTEMACVEQLWSYLYRRTATWWNVR